MKIYSIGEVGKVISGGTPNTKDPDNFGGDIAWLTPADLSGYVEKYISHGARNLTQKGYRSCSAHIMPAGSVLFSSRAPIGYVAIAQNPLCTNQGFKSVVPNTSIDSEFLYYQLLYLKKSIQEMGSGTTFKEISAKRFSSIKIVVPSLEEQRRIVSRIEELLSQLDSGVETLNTVKRQLSAYRQAVLKDTFLSCPCMVPLQSVCQHITDGDHMPPPKSSSGVPFIMISNIHDNVIDWSNTAHVGRDYFDNIDYKRKPQKGDVLYTVTGSFGIPVMVDFDREFCFQRHIALLRPKDSLNQRFLFYALQSPIVYAQANEKATGTAQKTVGLGVLRKISIPFFEGLEKQKAISFDIERKLSICQNIEQTVNAAVQQSEAMRQSILKRAFEENLL